MPKNLVIAKRESDDKVKETFLRWIINNVYEQENAKARFMDIDIEQYKRLTKVNRFKLLLNIMY